MNKWIILILSLILFTPDAYAGEPLDLYAAIQDAIRDHPSILVLQKEKAVADAGVRIEKQIQNPSFIAETTRSQPNYFLGGGYLFELGGKRSKRIEIASGEVNVAEMNLRLGLQNLRHEVRIAFYDLLLADQKESEVTQSRDLANKLYDVANERFTAGDVARLEVLEAGLELKRRENDLKQTEGERQSALVQLNVLLQRSPNNPLEIRGSLSDHPLSVDLDSLLQRAVSEHLNVLSIRQQVKTEEARLKLAHAERIPDLDVEGGTEINDADFAYGWRAAVRLDVPLFNRKQGEIDRSQATLDKLKAEEEVAIQKLRAEISVAYLRYQSSLFQSQNYGQEILPASAQIEQLAVESYQAGRTGILAVIDAQRSVRQVRLEYLDLLMQLQTALADLEHAAGTELE